MSQNNDEILDEKHRHPQISCTPPPSTPRTFATSTLPEGDKKFSADEPNIKSFQQMNRKIKVLSQQLIKTCHLLYPWFLFFGTNHLCPRLCNMLRYIDSQEVIILILDKSLVKNISECIFSTSTCYLLSSPLSRHLPPRSSSIVGRCSSSTPTPSSRFLLVTIIQGVFSLVPPLKVPSTQRLI